MEPLGTRKWPLECIFVYRRDRAAVFLAGFSQLSPATHPPWHSQGHTQRRFLSNFQRSLKCQSDSPTLAPCIPALYPLSSPAAPWGPAWSLGREFCCWPHPLHPPAAESGSRVSVIPVPPGVHVRPEGTLPGSWRWPFCLPSFPGTVWGPRDPFIPHPHLKPDSV